MKVKELPWFWLSTGFSLSVLLVSPSPTGKILAVVLLGLGAGASVRFDVLHPYVWFGGAFTIYAIAGPTLEILGVGRGFGNYDRVLDLEFLGLAAFLMVIPRATESGHGFVIGRLGSLRRGFHLFVAITMILIGLHLSFVWSSGVTTKFELAQIGSILRGLGFAFYFLNVAFSYYLINAAVERRRFPFYKVVLVAGSLFFSMMIVGERDILFSFVVVVAVIYHALYRRLSLKVLIIAGAAMLWATTATEGFRMALLTGVPDVEFATSLGGVVETMLGSEARTPSENLSLLLTQVPQDVPFLLGETLLLDVQQVARPGFLFGYTRNSTSWFNEYFFADVTAQGGGRGFSIVGAGYLNFGVAGVAGIMAFLGLVVRILFLKARKSLLTLLVYVNSMPIFMYSIRADLSIPGSQVLKHIVLPIVGMYVCGVVVSGALGSRPTLSYSHDVLKPPTSDGHSG